MKPIAVFFHTRLSGGDFPDHPNSKVDPDWGRLLFEKQQHDFKESGLYVEAKELYVGLNGGGQDQAFIGRRALPKWKILFHGENSRSLIPTMRFLHEWCSNHEDWLVLFFHAKGATHSHDPMTTGWRNCMTRHCISNWRQCVSDLNTGLDAVGCHWCKNSPSDPNADRWGSNPIFGGVFWWSKGSYLKTLPQLPKDATDRHSFYLPELWIGNGNPKVKDYAADHGIGGCK